MSRPRTCWPTLLLVLIAWAGGVLAEQRFPPPEFESGYQLPATQVPPPRSLSLQYLDVVVLIAALGASCYLVHRRRSRRGLVWLSLFSVAYFGFYRQGCICAIGAPQNVALALFDPDYAVPLTAVVFFLAPFLVSLFAGRTFCAGVCPHGALQDLVLLRPVRVPPWLEQGLGLIPFLYLGAGVAFAATGGVFLICRYDPIVPLFRLSGGFVMLTAGITLLVLAMFVGRPYCRFLCPYGALLRLAALVAKWRVTITPDFCTQCRLCEQACPYGAIREPAAAAPKSPARTTDRRRLTRLLLIAPIAILIGGGLGSLVSTAASRLNPTVALAERFADPKRPPNPPGPATPDTLALGRVEQDPRAILIAATSIRERFRLGGWLFGGWAALVVLGRLMSLSVRSTQSDFEPDRGACVACARCFLHCPNERVRLGLMSPADLPTVPRPASTTTTPPSQPAAS